MIINSLLIKQELKIILIKKINIPDKRKLASLPEYTPDMGALSESDILYYLSDVQNTTLKFNQTYFKSDYYNVNITTNKFLNKINYTYLQKLISLLLYKNL